MGDEAHGNTDDPGSPTGSTDGLSDPTLHDLKAALTAIKAHAQLVHRRLGRMDLEATDLHPLVGSLGVIDAAVARLAAHLDRLRRQDPPQQARDEG